MDGSTPPDCVSVPLAENLKKSLDEASARARRVNEMVSGLCAHVTGVTPCASDLCYERLDDDGTLGQYINEARATSYSLGNAEQVLMHLATELGASV